MTAPASAAHVARLDPDALEDAADALAAILHGCVAQGASVGFVQPFTPEAARQWWRERVFPAVRSGAAVLLGARQGGALLGTVQLLPAAMPNQPHRADVAKLLVHPQARRRGIARALMRALEGEARARGRWLLVLDTRSGDPSQRLYESLGFAVAGQIPAYCRHPAGDRFEPTTFMWKRLAP